MSSNEDLKRGYHHPQAAALLLRWLSVATAIFAVVVFLRLGILQKSNADWPMAFLALFLGLLLAAFLHIGSIFLEWCAAMYRRSGGSGSAD